MANEAISGILTNQVWSVWDVGKPQVATELMRRFGYQNQGTFDIIRQMGREKAVPGGTFYGYEDNPYHRTVTVKTTVGDPGAGNDATFVIAAADLDASNNFYLREGMVLTIPDTEVQCRVMSIDVTTPTAPAVTIKPFRSTDNIDSLVGGTELPITSSAFGAGTGQPDGTVVGVSKRTFYTQIFKESVGAEGDMLAQENWFEVYDTGENTIGWFTIGNLRAEYLLAQAIDGAFTLGIERTNSTMVVPSGEAGAGNNINGTRGFVPHIRANGYTLNYTGGAFDIEDLEDIGTYLRTQYVNSGKVLIMSGVKLSSDINRAAKDYFITDTGSAIMTSIYGGTFGGAPNMAGMLNFKVINLGDGFEYIIFVMDNWSNPTTFAVEDLEFNKKGVIMPVTSFKNPEPGGNGGKVDNFYIRYRAKDNYSRKFEMWTIGGAGGGQYVTAIDRRDWYIRGEMGLEVYKTNQSVIIEE